MKPTIAKIMPFDSTVGSTISFTWNGNRAYGSRLYVYDNETLALVLDDTVATYQLNHPIAAGVLDNNKKYVAQLQVYDSDNEYSALSDRITFYTIETPAFEFSDLPDKLESSSLTATIHYNSQAWEKLISYQFSLYNANKTLLSQSDPLYDETNISYTFKGLDTYTDYLVRATGVTENGLKLDTGYHTVEVRYTNPSSYSRLYLTNDENNGCIHVKSNIILVQSDSEEEYTYENGFIDLTEKSLPYDSGFVLKDGSTVTIRAKNLWQTADLIKMENDLGDPILLSSRIYPGNVLRFKLTVYGTINNYILYSEEQVFTDSDIVTVHIRRKNNIYQLVVFTEIGKDNPEYAMWYGMEIPSYALIENNDKWIELESGDTIKTEPNIYTEKDEPTDTNVNDLWFGE